MRWDIIPLYGIAKPKQIVNCIDRELFPVYLGKGVVPFSSQSAKRTNVTSTDLSKYQAVDCGDFVLNNQQAWRGSVGVSKYSGIVSPAYIVLELSDAITTKYADYLFQSRTMVDQYVVCSKGVGTIQRNIYWDYLKRTIVSLPPRDEQDQIVRYLNWKVSQINKLINAKRRQVALLKEKEQAIINRAVTNGLDPDVPMKDSGVAWLGKIPEEWTTKRLKYSYKEIDERTETGDEEMLSVSHLTGVTPRSQKNVYMFMSESNVGQKIIAPGDIAVNTMWAWMAALGVSRFYGIISPSYGTYRSIGKKAYNSDFLDLLLRTELYRSEYIRRSTGIQSSRLRLYPDKFLDIRFVLPSKEEQDIIVEFLMENTDRIDYPVGEMIREIGLLHEYCTSLISNVVTGKLDVRGVVIPEYEAVEDTVADEEIEATEKTEDE